MYWAIYVAKIRQILEQEQELVDSTKDHFSSLQAFLIAFTSDFLPRLYYQYTQHSNLTGYVDFTLAYAPDKYVTEHNVSCRYDL